MYNKYPACRICKQLPKNLVIFVQCPKGHLISKECFAKLPSTAYRRRCGLRGISVPEQIRNEIAERLLKRRIIQCTINGREETVAYGELQKHIETNCPYALVPCRYDVLGCVWRGERRHEKNHTHNSINHDDIVAQIKHLRKDNEKLEKDRIFKCLIHGSNINATIQFDLIWSVFKLHDQHIAEHCYAVEYCGDHRREIQVVVFFSLQCSKLQDKKELYVRCKLIISHLNVCRSTLNAYISYIPEKYDYGISSCGSLQINDEIIQGSKYESSWSNVTKISNVSDLNAAKELVQFHKNGIIRLFIKI